jgi:hypothetical protein
VKRAETTLIVPLRENVGLARAAASLRSIFGGGGGVAALAVVPSTHNWSSAMKKFVAVYLGTPAAMEKWKSLSESERKQREQAGMKAWGDWMTKNQAIVVEQGGPLGKTKRISAQGIADVRNEMAGYVVVKAESHEAAARLFEKHPHFTIFPGEAVEVMEILPIPGM